MSASEYAVACIASPICDETGSCEATISIVLPETKARAEIDMLGREVRDAAQSIETALGRKAA